MIAALLLASQTVSIAAPPIAEARPATTWSCQFNATDGSTFLLRGFFAEAPAGSDPNTSMATRVQGNGPSVFLGAQRYNAFDSYEHLRAYMIPNRQADGSNYTILMNLVKDDNLGLATITHYVPNEQTEEGRLSAFATGVCTATFHPLGYTGAAQ